MVKTKYTEKVMRIPIKSKTGKKLVMFDIWGAKLTKAEIQAKANEISKNFHTQGAKGKIMLQLDFPKDAPIRQGSGGWSDIGEKVKAFNIVDYDGGKVLEEPKYYSSFRIFVSNYHKSK